MQHRIKGFRSYATAARLVLAALALLLTLQGCEGALRVPAGGAQTVVLGIRG